MHPVDSVVVHTTPPHTHTHTYLIHSCGTHSLLLAVQAQWSSFNATVGGRLLAIVPEGAPCASDPSGTQCQGILASWNDPSWRAAQPGAMQDPVWEEGANGENCFQFGQQCQQVR